MSERPSTPFDSGLTAGMQPLDAAQAVATEMLLELHRALRASPGRNPRTGWLGRLIGRGVRGREPVRGLYLWGGVGRGKTYLMDWFADTLPLPGKRRLHFHHFMRDIHETMAGLPRQPDPLDVVADRWRREVRVLCLDELTVTDIADATILHRLLRALLVRGTTLVVTSNVPPRDLYPNGLQRALFLPAIDLLERHTRVHELDGGVDYRLRTLAPGGVWFDAESGEERLAERFERLTGGHRELATALVVNGRSIPVRRLGSDIGWLDFDALCATPRSASDYIEIAREHHTLLVSGVPVLGPDCEAAARRFVHLVDELYDRRIKLVLWAHAPLDRLYTGGIERFPADRLLSRLAEMQSLEYLGCASGDAMALT